MPRVVKKFDSSPPHAVRDAAGNPVFLVLPPGSQLDFDRNLERCERGWEATADPAFLIDALMWVASHKQTLPAWLTKALMVVCMNRRTKKQATDALNAAIRYARYHAVHAAQRSGKTWDEAYKQAAEWLAGTFAKGESPAMRTAYIKVARDLRNGRGKLYQFAHLPPRS